MMLLYVNQLEDNLRYYILNCEKGVDKGDILQVFQIREVSGTSKSKNVFCFIVLSTWNSQEYTLGSSGKNPDKSDF